MGNRKYRVVLLQEDYNRLEGLQKTYKGAVGRKQQEALSTFVTRILINTNAYIGNVNLELQEDLEKLGNKSILFNNIDKNFRKKILEDGSYENLFVKELARMMVLPRYVFAKEKEEMKEFQFRDAPETEGLLNEILLYNSTFQVQEIFASLIKFFLNQNRVVQEEIVHYNEINRIDIAIREKTCLLINGLKIRPYTLSTKSDTVSQADRYLLGMDIRGNTCILYVSEMRTCEIINEKTIWKKEEREKLKGFLDGLDTTIPLLVGIDSWESMEKTSSVFRRPVEGDRIEVVLRYGKALFYKKRFPELADILDQEKFRSVTERLNEVIQYRLPKEERNLCIGTLHCGQIQEFKI